jgi:uncharacterized membrane protein YfcA
MTPEFLTFLLLGAAAGGLINGFAGFGTALFTLGFWLHIMTPVQAVSMVVVTSVASGVQGLWLVRQSIAGQPFRLARFLIPALFGIPVGVALLSVLDPKVLKLTIAGFLILYGSFFTFRKSLPRLERRMLAGDVIVGFLGGLLGGAASLSGALPTIWCALRPWSKSETRAVLQPFNVTVLTIAILLFALNGMYSWHILELLAIALPTTLISSQLGIAAFKRLTDDQFRRVIILLMLVSGVVLLFGELFS